MSSKKCRERRRDRVHAAPSGPLQVIRRDERTGAPTMLFRVHVDRGISWDMAQGFLQQASAPPSPGRGAEAGVEGQTLTSPSPSCGDQSKCKQKHKITLGGRLDTTDYEADELWGRGGKDTKHTPPHSLLHAAAPDSVPSPSPSQGSDMLVDPSSDLQQLQAMECQSRLDCLDVPATATPSHIDTGFDTVSETYNAEQRPSVSDTANGVTPSADTAVASIGQPQQSPAFPQSSGHHLDAACHEEPNPQSFHSSLGTGSALGAVVADAPKADPRSSLTGEDAPAPPGVSGYYRPQRGAIRGVLLALETQGKGQVAVYRPATGPAARPMRLTELQEK